MGGRADRGEVGEVKSSNDSKGLKGRERGKEEGKEGVFVSLSR